MSNRTAAVRDEMLTTPESLLLAETEDKNGYVEREHGEKFGDSEGDYAQWKIKDACQPVRGGDDACGKPLDEVLSIACKPAPKEDVAWYREYQRDGEP